MSDTSYPVYQHYGTNAQRLAFTPSPPASGQPIYVWYETDTDKVFVYTTGWHQIASSASGSAISALTGDVTATGPGSAAATIANSAVTLAKIANASANSKLLGSGASGSGAPYSEITVGAGLAMTGTTLSATAGTPGSAWIEEKTPSGTGAITFSSLGSYTHLRIVYSARGDQVATQTLVNLTFNGDTGANYDSERANFSDTTGTYTGAFGATSAPVASIGAASATANYATTGEIIIPDYRGTTFYKSAMGHQAGALTAQTSTNIASRLFTGFWRNTAAVTSITLTLASGNYVSGSKFTLYGMV